MVIKRTYIWTMVALSLYVSIYIHMLVLVQSTCCVCYTRAWYALCTRAKYDFYRRLMDNRDILQETIEECQATQPVAYVQQPKVVARPRAQLQRVHKMHTDSPFIWPVEKGSFWISSYFGPRKDSGNLGFHYGIDLAAIKNTRVVASGTGRVVEAGYQPGYGNTVMLKHDRRFRTRYAHLNTIRVAKGDWVEKGKCIGTVGDTGNVRKEGHDGSHLHFELYEYGKRINPMKFLSK